MIAGVVALTVYLLGFTVTGRLVGRWVKGLGNVDGEDVLGVVAVALLWPLAAALAAVAGLGLLLGLLFGVKP